MTSPDPAEIIHRNRQAIGSYSTDLASIIEIQDLDRAMMPRPGRASSPHPQLRPRHRPAWAGEQAAQNH
jgi:hypothetical protein